MIRWRAPDDPLAAPPSPIIVGHSHSCTTMAVIKRGLGFTAAEQNLAALADKILANLWTCAMCSWSAGTMS
jgi:hypothetical protein